MNNKRYIINALVLTVLISILSGCSTKRDSALTTELANIKLELARAELAQAEHADTSEPIETTELAATSEPADIDELADIKDIAEEGFIYGLPIVMNYAVMSEFTLDKDSGQYKDSYNRIYNDSQVFTYKDTTIVTPNSDTPYSMLWLDLRAEPMVVSVPAVPKERYYSVQFIDGNVYNYGYVGSRTTGTNSGNYLVAGPNWKGEAPVGIKEVFLSSTPFSLTVFRTQLFNTEDISNVIKVQAGYKVQSLSAFMKQPAPPEAATINFLPATTKGIKENFYTYLDAALQFVPMTSKNRAVRARLARIGVGPGKTFEFKDLALEHKADVSQAIRDGDKKINDFLATGMKNINGWKLGALFGDLSFYNGNWLKRAAAARAGIFGNDALEAMYPMTRTDANGEPLDGSKHNYTLTFPADQLPPVNAFWSVTMYNGKTQFLIKNPINRYLINSPMLTDMHKNEDGSLTLYIQKDSPGKTKEANWLPAPDGPIYLVMRLYWPKVEAPSILPIGKGTWAPAPVVQVQ